ncbi:MAG TPA: hypothetical protein VFP72_21210 [Kineosporiaceae bacterium]|nr:hypothetical protein [Kineosporiaceae bacterium]
MFGSRAGVVRRASVLVGRLTMSPGALRVAVLVEHGSDSFVHSRGFGMPLGRPAVRSPRMLVSRLHPLLGLSRLVLGRTPRRAVYEPLSALVQLLKPFADLLEACRRFV